MPSPRPSNRCLCSAPRRPARGATLIELVIAIVIFATASAAIVSIFTDATKSSADPQIRAQGRAIAEAYMDEILLQKYCEDPESDCSAETSGGGSEEGGNRDAFDDVWDYDGLTNNPPEDQLGNPLSQVADYTVSVTVDGDPGSSDTAEITVNVTHSSGKIDYDLVGNREKY